MDFEPSKSTQAILDKIELFLNDELRPVESQYLTSDFKEIIPILKKKRQLVKKLGLWGPNLPKELGGMGLSLLDHGLVSEVLGTSPLGHYVFGCQAPDAGNIEILHKFGNAEQKSQYLKPLADGDIRSCFSMTERDTAGSNPLLLKTTAIKDGDDFVINGEKWFSTSADGSAFSIVMAVTNPNTSPARGSSMIIVPMDTPGLKLVRNIPVMGHAGGDYDSHGQIEYNDCRVPRKNLLGKEGLGFLLAQERLGPGRIHHCMRWLGICRRTFEVMCERAASRKISENEILGDKQIVQEWIADSAAEIHAARMLVLHTAWLIDKLGVSKVHENIGMIKYFTANVMQKVIDRAVQTLGGLGITDDTIISHYYRHERAARIYDGPDEVHKVSVAKKYLKKYKKK